MHKRRIEQREGVMAMLWSEFLALWFDRARRRAVPLLLATLLLLIPLLPASADCTCGPGEHHQGTASHHEGDQCYHEAKEAHEHSPAKGAATSSASASTERHLVARSQMTVSGAEVARCFCPRAPVGTSVVAPAVPAPVHAHSQALVYVRVHAQRVFRFDTLTGLFGRAGPPPDGKPQLVFLASLVGRAPPVSI